MTPRRCRGVYLISDAPPSDYVVLSHMGRVGFVVEVLTCRKTLVVVVGWLVRLGSVRCLIFGRSCWSGCFWGLSGVRVLIKRDPRFVKEWDRRCAELNIHPERTQSVIDSLFRQAADGDVKAASLYLQYIDKFTPKRRVVVDDERAASGLSDLELADELEALVAEFRDAGSEVEVDLVEG